MGKKKNRGKPVDHIERESKYLLQTGSLGEVLDLIKSYVQKGDLLIAGVRDIVIEDKYYDSSSYLMAANGLCLRLRSQPDRPRKLTLKQEINRQQIDSPVYERLETEMVANATNAHTVLSSLPWTPSVELSAVNSDTEQVFRDFGFEHIFTLRNKRRIYTLITKNNSSVELSIDKGEIISGKAKAKLRELELELLTGRPVELVKLSNRLEKKVQGLSRSPSSKYQRGLLLLCKWKHDPNWVASEKGVWRRELGGIFKQLESQIDKVLRDGAVKSVHKSRVCIRRLLTLLEFLNDRSKPATRITTVLRTLQKSLGNIRDLDVMLISYREDPDSPPTAALIELLELQRTNASSQFKSLCDSDILVEMKAAWKAFTSKSLVSAVNNIHVVHRYEKLYDRLSLTLDKYEMSVAATGQFSVESMRQLHKVRIASKKLRYATEYLTFALPGNSPRFLDKLISAQDSLGKIQDLFTFGKILDLMKGKLSPLLADSFDQFAIDNNNKLKELLTSTDIHMMLSQHETEPGSRLSDIRGIGDLTEIKLQEAGIYSLEDLKAHIESSFSGVPIDSMTRILCERYDWHSQLKSMLETHEQSN